MILCTSGRLCISRIGKKPFRTIITMKLVSNSCVSDACCGSAVICCIDAVKKTPKPVDHFALGISA
jgi:hypothetical protein